MCPTAEGVALDAHYTDPALVALYDAECGWSPDRDFYAALPGAAPLRVLDLGCGTGLLTVALAAQGHAVTGADPSAEMLAVARARPSGARVRWVQGLAQDAGGPFDLAIMTGHVFQTLTDDAAIAATFAAVRARLAPGGRFVFETRNPGRPWAARWTGSRMVDGVRVERWVDRASGEHITFTTRYHLPGGARDSVSRLRFAPLATVLRLARAAGFTPGPVRGDWDGAAFDAARHDEMIVLLEARRDD